MINSASDKHSEEQWLRQCLRDLTALTSLPLLCKDKSPREIANILATVLQSNLRSDFVFVRIRGPFTEEPIDVACAARQYPKVDARKISEQVAPFLELESGAVEIPNPVGSGELQITLSPLGFLNEYGVVVVGGSRANGFPTTTDQLLINVATNQVATVLETVALQISERELQAKTQSQQRLLETVLKQLPCGVIIANPTRGDILLKNAQATEVLDSSVGQFDRQTLLDLEVGCRPDDQSYEPKEWSLARTIFNGEVVKDEEFEYVRSDGERRYIVVNSAPVRNDRGELIAGVVALQDITELRLTQQRLLLKSEDKYRDLIDLSPDAIFIVDSEGKYISGNPAALKLVKCTEMELNGLPIIDTYLPEERGSFRDRFERLKTEAIIRFERTFLRSDGTTVPVEVSASQMRHGSFQTVVRDLSHRKRREAALKKAEEALRKAQADLAHVSRVTTMGELVASIAHEVNQPLGAIVTNGSACLRLLSRETPNLDRSREVIERMISDGMRASEVIKRIRDLLHKSPAEKTPLNINEIVQEVIALVSSDVLRSKVDLRAELAADLPLVTGDRIQLQQVILNLILNARDAMSEVHTHSRELLVTTLKNKSGDVVVAVRDSGKGLDAMDVERIFEPFFTTKSEGLGLGLSISRRIIEDHGGTLWARSNKDRGAIVQFAIPAISESV
jgi:PAS domain S-box-containing protein